MRDVARVLATRYHGISKRELSDVLVRVVWLVDPTARYATKYLGHRARLSSDKASVELDWKPRDAAETIIDAAESLINHGLASARPR